MRRSRLLRFLPVFIALILFVIPFFWLAPGEMDLGGDSGRLYFYDPLTYLKTHLLHGVILSGIGGSTLSYFAIPYVLMLAGFRLLFSPTIVIAISQGMKLSIAFLSGYLIVKELLSYDDKLFSQAMIELSSLVAGLFYIFSPIIVNSGWDRALLTHTQVFVYPLMFYLMLRYLTTRVWSYVLGMLLISYLFSINFSFFAAPGFFAFFPLSLVYLFLYVRFIRHKPFPYKGILIGLGLFLLIQSFHVIPHMLGLFVSGEFAGVFSEESIIVRGLDYFLGIAPNIKVSAGFFNLAQMRRITVISWMSVIFPLILVGGLFVKKRMKPRLLYLTVFFFIVTLFFETANITDIGFTAYKYLFYIPGFKMFRNFFAQWSMVFVFYYTILVGLSLPWVLGVVRTSLRFVIVGLMAASLGLSAYPLLSGTMVNDIHYQTKNVKQNIRMDPVFDRVLAAVRSLPIDGKILSLPLVGPGYQLFTGLGGDGVYMGPSPFSYLAGRNDFTGFDGMAPYGQTFLDAALREQWDMIKRLFAILNIKYIFYNPDPAIYEQNFPKFPYDFVMKFLPKTQREYQAFIPNLPIDEQHPITLDRFVFFPTENAAYLPHIFTGTNAIYTNYADLFAFNQQLNPNIKDVILPVHEIEQAESNVILEAEPVNPFAKFKNNVHFHKHAPFLSVPMSDLQYPFVVIKEKLDLLRARRSHLRYFDLSFLFLTKRIFELDRWGDAMPILRKPQAAPRLKHVFNPLRYNTWEAALARYEEQAGWVMQWIIKSNPSDAFIEIDTLKAKEQFDQHRKRLLSKLKGSHLKEKDVSYLRILVEAMFGRIYQKLNAKIYDMSLSYYKLKVPPEQAGEYEVLLQFENTPASAHLPYQLTIGDQTVTGSSTEAENVVGKLQDTVTLKGGTAPLVVHSKPVSLLSETSWINSGSASTKESVDTLSLTNVSNDYIDGLVKEIPGWEGDNQYMITFEYNTHGEYFLYRLFDKQLVDEETGQLRTNIFFEKNLHSLDWRKQQSLVSANKFSKSAYLQFLIESNKTSASLDIRNVSVVRIDSPHVFLRKKAYGTTVQGKTPSIVFQKINPTKYQVDVSGATDPYILVFLEAFDKHWRLIDSTKEEMSIAAKVLRLLGRMYGALGAWAGATYNSDGEITATYFDGSVAEGNHIYSFLDPRNFSSWGNAGVASREHYPAYGYANAWRIKPSFVDNKTDYTLYLEMSSQKNFYIFFTLSVIGLLFIAGWMISLLVHRLWYASRH